MSKIPNELTANFGDPECRRQLMKKYGNGKNAYYGANGNGEAVLISISAKNIQVTTYQDNGWVRIDVYDERGHKESERFDGRWRSSNQNKASTATKENLIAASIKKANEPNPNYTKRRNDITFASDVCKAVLHNVSLSSEVKEKLVSAIETLDSIARR